MMAQRSEGMQIMFFIHIHLLVIHPPSAVFDSKIPAATFFACTLIAIALAAWGPCPPTSFDPTHPTFLRMPLDFPYSIMEAIFTIPIIIHSVLLRLRFLGAR